MAKKKVTKKAKKKVTKKAKPKQGEVAFSFHFQPKTKASTSSSRKMLEKAGFSITAETSSGSLVVSGTKSQIENLMPHGVKEKMVERKINHARGYTLRRSYLTLASDEAPPSDSTGNGTFIFPVPFNYHQQPPSAYPPRVDYYHLHPSRDLPDLFGVRSLHAQGIRGDGIRVVMIDSGFYRHPYYEDPGSHGGIVPQITTDGVLPATQGGQPEVDDIGHGTAIAANTIALAPECDFHHIKDDNDPVAAFAMARNLDPQIITCSWGWEESLVYDELTNNPNGGNALYFKSLRAEIQAAIAAGITVLVAAGNGNSSGSWPSSEPGVICVGGALVDENLELLTSDYATSFVSAVNAGRTCPDVCGIVGPAPSGLLFALPTQPNNTYDQSFSGFDGTQSGDGWMIASGTSSATPQLAAIAALLMEIHGTLTPNEVLEMFRDMAVGVHQGNSATGQAANRNRPNGATGHGWVTFRRPHSLHRYSFF